MTTTTPLYQRTLAHAVSITGIGLHSGKDVTLTFAPAPADTGIVFVRTDLDNAHIPMSAHLVVDTMMSSNLVAKDTRVGTVEHVLSAVSAYGIDNLYIQVNAPEMPIMDGSACQFLALMDKAGIQVQSAPKKFIKIIKPIEVSMEDKWARLEPYDEGFLMDFEIDFDHVAIKATNQHAIFDFGSANFADDISQARTFGFLKDLQALRQHNLALGGSLDNAIVLDDTSVMNEGGLRYPDEFVRHKILDAVGDLYVIGHALLAKFSAYKSGHALNNALIRAVLADPDSHKIVSFCNEADCPIDYNLAKSA